MLDKKKRNKKRMKGLVALALASGLILTACDSTEDSAPDESGTQTVEDQKSSLDILKNQANVPNQAFADAFTDYEYILENYTFSSYDASLESQPEGSGTTITEVLNTFNPDIEASHTQASEREEFLTFVYTVGGEGEEDEETQADVEVASLGMYFLDGLLIHAGVASDVGPVTSDQALDAATGEGLIQEASTLSQLAEAQPTLLGLSHMVIEDQEYDQVVYPRLTDAGNLVVEFSTYQGENLKKTEFVSQENMIQSQSHIYSLGLQKLMDYYYIDILEVEPETDVTENYSRTYTEEEWTANWESLSSLAKEKAAAGEFLSLEEVEAIFPQATSQSGGVLDYHGVVDNHLAIASVVFNEEEQGVQIRRTERTEDDFPFNQEIVQNLQIPEGTTIDYFYENYSRPDLQIFDLEGNQWIYMWSAEEGEETDISVFQVLTDPNGQIESLGYE